MPLIGGAIMPHGALILDPHRSEMSDTLKNASKNLNDACLAAAAAIEANKPDLILLYTPHGLIADGADMHIYTNSSASGTAEWMGSWSEHRVAVKCDTQAAQSLVTHLKNDGCSAAERSSAGGKRPKASRGCCHPGGLRHIQGLCRLLVQQPTLFLCLGGACLADT